VITDRFWTYVFRISLVLEVICLGTVLSGQLMTDSLALPLLWLMAWVFMITGGIAILARRLHRALARH